MTFNPWGPGVGIGRIEIDSRPVVVLHRDGTTTAAPALVDGVEFHDLPDLLLAADGDATRIERGVDVTIDPAHLLSPVSKPRKIVCVGQNYLNHVAETGRTAPPPYPDLFPKWDNTLSGPRADIPLPPESTEIDFESELAVVIGRRARRVTPDELPDVVFGYTASNDGSVRDYQFHSSQRTAGKTWDGLTPVGPVVVPASALGGATPDLRITGLHNDVVVQDDRTSNLVFGVPQLITYISSFMTLEPGDLVLTGTPAGVGAVRTPPLYLQDGDEFEVRIEGIGSLHNTYKSEKI